MPPQSSPPPPRPLPAGANRRTLGMMAIVYVVVAATLTAKPSETFNYGTASVGVISYLIVEGASLLSEAIRVFSMAHDGNMPPAYVGYLTKTLAGMVIFGGAFGRVDVAWEAVSTLRAFLYQLQAAFAGKQ